MNTREVLERAGVRARIVDGQESPDGKPAFRIDCRLSQGFAVLDETLERVVSKSQRDRVEFLANSNQSMVLGKHWVGLERVQEGRAGKQDMVLFNQALKKFEQGALSKKLRPAIEKCVLKRKRFAHEYDGEWQYDRRHDDQAFLTQKRTLSDARQMTVMADFVCGASADDESVDRYGALVFGITQMLERAGLKVAVIARNLSKATDSKQSMMTDLRIRVKDAGQYMAPNLLAGTFHADFYRRFCFGLRQFSIDACGHLAYWGVGSGFSKLPIEYLKGTLSLTAEAIHACDDDLEKQLLAALRG